MSRSRAPRATPDRRVEQPQDDEPPFDGGGDHFGEPEEGYEVDAGGTYTDDRNE